MRCNVGIFRCVSLVVNVGGVTCGTRPAPGRLSEPRARELGCTHHPRVSSRKINHLPHPNTTKQTERYTRKVAIPFPRSRTPLASDRDIGGEKRG
ncbi:BZ3500_MvSof-1268-A1-R1_Chr2-2g05136 [Microbotryum saponariae]|uniref:BZ3500_MvSof-1268-A1-R1_Chr2-2g05136 protein n=1 Tax=Microbotryum saponariae TaxID=289078 RepID=A0A2X0LPE0_9BASI|nr:BZ3500_MvSof-1268-A1-R1_Chr2-2g05136 [Microbotryum saponariae]SDA00963.1 BZ3501_MvSof-1269-A2-R1_Chr2-2g04810 [Microbotryum saponariae]